MATLDPLGMPVTTLVVPGNCADDPLYVPEIKKVQRAFGQGGKTFVMDCKGASLATRAFLADTGDYYLCPLSETQLSAEKRHALLRPVWQGRQRLQQVYRPAEDPAEGAELVAEGFSLDVPVAAEVEGQAGELDGAALAGAVVGLRGRGSTSSWKGVCRRPRRNWPG